jgi:hypothetical protein
MIKIIKYIIAALALFMMSNALAQTDQDQNNDQNQDQNQNVEVFDEEDNVITDDEQPNSLYTDSEAVTNPKDKTQLDNTMDPENTDDEKNTQNIKFYDLYVKLKDVFFLLKMLVYVGAGFSLVFISLRALKGEPLEPITLLWFALTLVMVSMSGLIVQAIINPVGEAKDALEIVFNN